MRVRLYRRRRLVQPDRVTVAELVQHGLGRRPEAVGIFWPDSQVTVCREHIEDDASLKMLDAVRPSSDAATVLVGDDLGQKMPWLCALAHEPDGG